MSIGSPVLFAELCAQGSVMFVMICSFLRVAKDILPSHTLKRLTVMSVRTPTPCVFFEFNSEPPIISKKKTATALRAERPQHTSVFVSMLQKAGIPCVTLINSGPVHNHDISIDHVIP